MSNKAFEVVGQAVVGVLVGSLVTLAMDAGVKTIKKTVNNRKLKKVKVIEAA